MSRSIVNATAAARTVGRTGDDALVRRAAARDATAFDALLATRLDRCYRLAFSILENEADARDATQDGVVSAWRQLPRLRDVGAFDAWLNRTVANAARMARRHRTRLREIEPIDAGDGGGAETVSAGPVGGSSIGASVAMADAVGRAFSRLRESERLLLVLHHAEDRPLAEIAQTLGITVSTTKWRLHEARRALERALEAEA
jgi:RNA polymerase sigma-70 factor (ECF subfamily)